MKDSFGIFGYTNDDCFESRLTPKIIRKKFIKFMTKYHPDKDKPDVTGLDVQEATEFVHVLGNTKEHILYLLDQMDQM